MDDKNNDYGPRPGEVRDGSCARLAIPPGDSRPGWDNGMPGNKVEHSDTGDIVPGATKRS